MRQTGCAGQIQSRIRLTQQNDATSQRCRRESQGGHTSNRIRRGIGQLVLRAEEREIDPHVVAIEQAVRIILERHRGPVALADGEGVAIENRFTASCWQLQGKRRDIRLRQTTDGHFRWNRHGVLDRAELHGSADPGRSQPQDRGARDRLEQRLSDLVLIVTR